MTDFMRRTGRATFVALAMIGIAGAVNAQEEPGVAEARRFLDLLRAGSWADAAALISPSMPAQLQGPAALETVWSQVRGSVGELQALEFLKVQAVDSSTSVDFLGTFPGQKLVVRVVITAARQVSGFWLLPAPPSAPMPGPAYADSTAFREETVELGEPGFRLGGTISLPRGPGREAAVVLVHGSGAHDRDETIGPNKVFRDLAHGLASRGIAVLRYDKRTKVHGARMRSPTVEQEVIDDALAAVALLRERPDVDPARIYVLGHSLGGSVGPEIARRDGRLGGLVLFAAPARDIVDVIEDQLDYLGTLPQNQSAEGVQRLTEMREQLQRIRSDATPDSALVMGAPASYFRDLRRYDPVTTARALTLPILVLQAERDYQVTMKDFALWTAALEGRADTRLRAFPALNHLFLAGSGPPNPAEYERPGHVALEVIEEIVRFIR